MSTFLTQIYTQQIAKNYFVSRETMQRLESFAQLLSKWNKAINLIKFSHSAELWHRHILDSIQLINHINPDKSVIDLGSGGGFPGIILSILGVKTITLVESDNRKCMFLYQASKLSTNKIIIENQRIEDCLELKADIITSRALCDISRICSFVARININAKLILLKGKSVQNEVKSAKNYWAFDHNLYPSITAPDSYIIEIFNLRNKNL